jgi:hypothetical protein
MAMTAVQALCSTAKPIPDQFKSLKREESGTSAPTEADAVWDSGKGREDLAGTQKV